MKKTIKCKFSSNMVGTKKVLEEKYNIVECEEPDFAFFSCADIYKCYKYDCVRILEIGENQRPNFNLFDYAYGFDKIQFENRYLYFPLYANEEYSSFFRSAIQKHTWNEKFFSNKEKFCNMVVSNVGSASEKRIEFFKLLSNYKTVDSGGRSYNNLPDGKPVVDKLEFQRNYKFSLAFENSSYPGYATEKIIQAWAAGTIPIYWGDPTIGEQFNEKAFINCHAYSSWEEVIERIKEIDQNQELYLAMQREPITKEGLISYDFLNENYYKDWIYGIIEAGKDNALKRVNSKDGWGYYAERDARYFDEMSRSKLVRFAYKISRIVGKIRGNN